MMADPDLDARILIEHVALAERADGPESVAIMEQLFYNLYGTHWYPINAGVVSVPLACPACCRIAETHVSKGRTCWRCPHCNAVCVIVADERFAARPPRAKGWRHQRGVRLTWTIWARRP